MTSPLRAAAALLACVGLLPIPSRAELPPGFAAAVAAAGIPLDAVGLSVRRLSDNAEVYAHQADRPMPPASTMKVLTTIVGLERLGPGYRGFSELRTTGGLANGVLKGDVYLRGVADVDLDWQSFERMLKRLRMQGIREIEGDLVLDRALFNPARSDVGVAPFDQSPEFRYNVIPDALLLNTNLVELDLASPKDAVEVSAWTPLDRVTFTSEMKLVDRACESWEDGWVLPAVSRDRRGGVQVKLRGDFPRDCLATTAINVIDRVTFADRLFRALWARQGGRFRGATREGEMPPDARLLAQHRSRTLTDVARDVNKRSDNPIARMVYLALGTTGPEKTPESTFARADREVRRWLERRGIDSTGLVLENGSGLSRLERIRPEQLTAVLRAASASEWAPEFVSSLPITGVDGSMRRRLVNTPAAERSRIKTGTLRDVSAVAGYVKDGNGDTLVVAAILHHPKATRDVARPLLDQLLETLSRSTTRAAAPSGS